MRAEEHRLAALAGFCDAAAKFSLHQRIQAAGRLVEHQKRRPGRERRDKRDLLPVARRIGLARLVEVQIEAVDQTRRGRPRRRPGRHCRAARGFRRPSVAATAQHPPARTPGGGGPDGRRPARNRIPARPGRAGQAEQHAWSSTCRHRRAEEAEHLAGARRSYSDPRRPPAPNVWSNRRHGWLGRKAVRACTAGYGCTGCLSRVGLPTADPTSRRTKWECTPSGRCALDISERSRCR